jgi:hypothetical protein
VLFGTLLFHPGFTGGSSVRMNQPSMTPGSTGCASPAVCQGLFGGWRSVSGEPA